MLSTQNIISMRRDRGFTLVEMIVALLVIVVVLGLIFALSISMLMRSEKSGAERRAIRQAEETISLFRNEVQKTRSPDRDNARRIDQSQLSRALLQGAPIQSGTITLDVRDVVEATNSSFAFRADIDKANPGSECVRYWFDSSAKQFKHTVTATANPAGCSGAVLSEQVLVKQVKG